MSGKNAHYQESFFVLGIELFARALKNDGTIKGIQVDKQELKIVQYADDTTVFVKNKNMWYNYLSF